MKRVLWIGLAAALMLGGCWDFSAMRKEGAAEFTREQEARLPVARAKGEAFAGLSAGDRRTVETEVPAMQVSAEEGLFPRFDTYAWSLAGGRTLKVVYARMEVDEGKEWTVTMEGGR